MARNSIFEKRQNNFTKYIIILVIIIFFCIGSFIFISPQFEQNKPQIICDNEIFWNLKTKLKIKIIDDTGVKYYKITYNDNDKKIKLNNKIIKDNKKEVIVEVTAPRLDIFHKNKNITLKIEAVDNSKWNYFNGNIATKTIKLHIDTKKPIANVIDNTRYIRRGGSAVVVVKVKDDNLKNAYISFNDKINFKLIPFYKKDYFVSLIAWDIDIEEFKKVNLIACDKANNKTIVKIPFYIQPLKVKKDTINITPHFIQSVSSNVLEQSEETIPENLKDRFIKQNKYLREKNIKFLRDFVSTHNDMTQINDFNIQPFKRLKGSRTVSKYAERRTYLYNNEKIDEAWHLGIDWASIKKAPIRASNNGKVIYNDYLGIYGNTIIIDHKMGLSSLYAHISSSNVQVGDIIKARKKIAKTGSTGAVMGDHLHFGILIQGIEVNPLEWMDKHWIKTNITKILENSKKEIDLDL
jgi:murein DD-endopeptidase MepM/ murein hydrolase activator NlpD